MAHVIKNKILSGGSTDLLRTHTNSPVRSVTAGTTINVMTACLIDGFGQVTLSSLTIDSLGIATATSSNHGYLKIHTVILIAGADQEAINGEWSITAIPNSNEVKFDASESGLTSTTITGATITMKVAPLGWSKPFSDAPNNIAVYQSLNPYSRRNFLRVDDADNLAYNDNGLTYMRGYEYMTSADDSGSYGFPPKSVLPRGGGFKKNLNSTNGIYFPTTGINISWVMVGNSNQFFFSTATIFGNTSGTRANMFFGDLVSYVPGDVGATGLSIEAAFSTLTVGTDALSTNQAYSCNFCPRNSRRLHSVVQQRWKMWNPPTISTSSGIVLGKDMPVAEPDVYSNKIILYRPFYITDENNSNSIRGEMPGISLVLSNLTALSPNYEPGQVLTFNSERFVYMPTYVYSGSFGFFLLTLDKDWNIPIT